jgi:glycosyltransferase involved in cell wall biosynthesis
MKFSIITVTYNAERFIEKTIQSVINQTYSDFEYIIVDGQSTDKTLEKIQNLKPQIPNLKLLSETDSGLYDAMNKGLALATGDFVWFINAGDEIFSDNTLQNIVNKFSILNSPFSIIYGQSLIIDEKGNPLGERHKIAPKILSKNSFLNGLVVCHQSILVRREIASQYNLNYKVSADYDWTITAVSQSQGNLYIDDYLSKFMTSGISSIHRKRGLIERFTIMKKHFGLVRTLFSHFVIVIKYPFTRKY